MTDQIPAYSPDTGKHYPSWEDLVEAESNGWVVVAVWLGNDQSVPFVVGPFANEKEAVNAQARVRKQCRREHPGARVKVYKRILWKDARKRIL